MTVQPHEPVSGWWFPDFEDPMLYQQGMSWPWCDFKVGGLQYHPCRVTLANGQKIIVRALSEERKVARLFRMAHKLGVMRSQEEMDQMSRDFEYARVNAESECSDDQPDP